MVRIGNPMSESHKDGCYCQKCGAPVDPTDEECPNGHVLAEVGRAYVRSASGSIKFTADAVLVRRVREISDQLNLTSGQVVTLSGEIVNSSGACIGIANELKSDLVSLEGSLRPDQADLASEAISKIDAFSTSLQGAGERHQKFSDTQGKYNDQIKRMNEQLEIIVYQTRELSFLENIRKIVFENTVINIITVILSILGLGRLLGF